MPPNGSFHFPDGKDQLVAEAVMRAAAITAESMATALQDRTVGLPERIEGFFVAVADDLSANDYGPGCAVASLEGATLLARARHDTAPLVSVGVILRAAVTAARNELHEPAARGCSRRRSAMPGGR